jgi:hypothetical protein
VPPKRLLTFNGLHGVISQVLFITAAVRAPNPTSEYNIRMNLDGVGCITLLLWTVSSGDLGDHGD